MFKKFIIILTLLFSTAVNAADLKKEVENKANSAFNENINSFITEYLGLKFPTSEVSLSTGITDKVSGGILIVAPLSDINNTKNTIFTQGSIYFSDDNRETLNLGIGNRILLNDDKLLLGANAFFDYEPDYDHQRSSLGIEAKTSVGEFTANKYFGMSDWQVGFESVEERASSGEDYEVGVPLPYLPWAYFYARAFEWEGRDGVADLKGDEISLKANLLSGLSVEAGKRSIESGGAEDDQYLRLTWTCCNKEKNVSMGVSDKAYNLTSVADLRFAKVRRQNLIVKQKKMSLSIIGF